MNICLVTTLYPPEIGGGIGTYVYNLSIALAKLGHSVNVITKTKNIGYSLEKINGVSLHRMQEKTLPYLETYLPGICWSAQVYKLIQKINSTTPLDIIEFPNWEAPGFISQLFIRKIATVVRVHTPYFETLALDKKNKDIGFDDKAICFFEKASCKLAKQLVSSTLFHAKMIAKEYKLSPSQFSIIPLGVIDKGNAELSVNKRNIPSSTFKLLYVSRLENRKGTLTLIKALPEILNNRDNIHIDFVGSDRPHAPGGETYKKYFIKNFPELSDNVSFHGYVSDEELDSFYKNADIFVVPSIYESFGLIYIEAMMYGLPSIATMGGGIPEVIEHLNDGILLQENTPSELANNVILLYEDDNLRNSLAKRSRQSFENKFNYLSMANKTIQTYKQTVNK